MKKIIALVTSLLVATLSVPSFASSHGGMAHGDKVGNLTIMHPWARATAKSAKTGAGYMMITNAGTTSDKLINVKSDMSRKTEIHQSSMKDGMMKMERVDGITIPANGKAELKPGGYHIMFMGLKAPLQVDTEFPLTLVFEKSGEVTVNVTVSKGGGMKMMDHKMDKKKMTP